MASKPLRSFVLGREHPEGVGAFVKAHKKIAYDPAQWRCDQEGGGRSRFRGFFACEVIARIARHRLDLSKINLDRLWLAGTVFGLGGDDLYGILQRHLGAGKHIAMHNPLVRPTRDAAHAK